MYNNTNPAELYAGTTWELLPDNKFLKTGSTPLQQAGSNSIKIAKTNLPTDKLQISSFSMNIGAHTHNILNCSNRGNLGQWVSTFGRTIDGGGAGGYSATNIPTSSSGNGSTSSASPYTTAMGSGTAITINPEHITIKAWKRTK